mgnify:CR=1 FL=1
MTSIFAGVFESDIAFGEEQFATDQTMVLHIASSQDRSVGSFHYWITDRRILPAIKEHFAKQGYDDVNHTLYSSRANWTSTYGAIAPLQLEDINRNAEYASDDDASGDLQMDDRSGGDDEGGEKNPL